MLDRIIAILKSNQAISDWKIIQRRTESNELFLIRNKVAMPRSKNVKHIAITVYKDFQEDGKAYRGSSTVNIHPTMTEHEIASAIEDAAFAASFIKNQYYPLPAEQKGHLSSKSSRFDSASLVEWMPKIKEALYKHDNYRNGHINSSEIFLNKNHTTILNSKGIHHSYENYNGYIELITSWNETGEEIELFKDIAFSDFEPEMLSASSQEMLELSREKAVTQATPNLESFTVILQGDSVAEMFKYYYAQSNAQSVYQKVSTAKLNESIQGGNIQGDKVTLTLDPALTNSAVSVPVDDDGIILTSHKIIEEGILQKYWGDNQYSYYLGVSPTGSINNMIFEGGSMTIEEMRQLPHLEIAAFSDLSMDTVTSDFAGEIRLGWYYYGKTRVTISGGSISGNLKSLQENMYLSKELQQCSANELRIGICYKGPKALMLHNVSVAGS